MKLNDLFLDYCKTNKFEVNSDQLTAVIELEKFYLENKFSLKDIFFLKEDKKYGFYLHGDVGVGKTMILNFFFEKIEIKKLRLHFNEFMINFHDFKFKNENRENIIKNFVNDLKKRVNLLYFDEFQVTNIADAMILGKLFKEIFNQKIVVLFSSNLKIDDLYKGGLQRDQFLPFIKLIKKLCIEYNLEIDQDYRLGNKNIERYLSPINSINNFKKNKFLREITKGIEKKELRIDVKGRKFLIKNYFNGISVLDFKDLCDKAVGAEDYIEISNRCDFLLIENLPSFDEFNSNQQQRFITLIDILYEKNIPIMITSEIDLQNITSSKSLEKIFKRTVSRLFELTSINYKK